MSSTVILLSDVIQIVAIISVVTIWLVTAPRLKSPWIPCSNFSRVAVVGLVFLYCWNKFVAEIIFLHQPIYVWYGLVLILAVIAHWAKISCTEPNKQTESQ